MLFKKIFVICIALCVIGLASCGSGQESPPVTDISETPAVTDIPENVNPDYDLAGLWHESPVVGSGFAARLLLDDNNTYVWLASQMDGMGRVRASSGQWRVKDGRLELETTEEIRWNGGRLVPAFASWGTDEVIVEAEIVLISLTEPELSSYDFSMVTTDPEVLDKKTVTIGGTQYWELPGPGEQEELYADYAYLQAQVGTIVPDLSPDNDVTQPPESAELTVELPQDMPEVPNLWNVEYTTTGEEPRITVNVLVPMSSYDFRGTYYGSATIKVEIQYDPGDGIWRDADGFELLDGPPVASAISLGQPAGDIYPYSSFRARMVHSYYDINGNYRSSASGWSEVKTGENGDNTYY